MITIYVNVDYKLLSELGPISVSMLLEVSMAIVELFKDSRTTDNLTSFLVESGQIIVGDPQKGFDSSSLQLTATPGRWLIEVGMYKRGLFKEGDKTLKISSVTVVHVDAYRDDGSWSFREVGVPIVDSGTFGVFDMKYFEQERMLESLDEETLMIVTDHGFGLLPGFGDDGQFGITGFFVGNELSAINVRFIELTGKEQET